ncbi:MAG: serine/threonine-protein kinase [Gemmataceae bacterium]
MSEAADPHTPSADAVSEVVFRVRELPTLEHARAIEDLCGCQPEVAEEVRRRLRVLELADQALGLTADPATLPHRDGEDPGLGVLPGYEVLGELGRGGMGVVYRARQTSLGREVAVKMILDATHAGEEEMGRFRREAEALARAQHPNIVQVFDIAGHGGRPFISLEYCAGGSLEKKLGGTPLRPREAAALVATLAGAMQAAHQAGVVHRDLKPANVLLALDGTPKISDFGLAKKLGEAGLTQSGALMGTPSYMAPEQAEGKKEVGPATDIYALGAVLYECLTGRPRSAPRRCTTPSCRR